ncbi:MAG: TlyA family RNA methyltransferase [SAR324 cluster bacterium]|nr:TlyA family RNA methyltransferase [SAR324 cluster bacterium]MBL7034253.1 TlyA family RNA methyltransferase [SAR324 cluster bacterium]
MKQRLDRLLVEQKLAPSREKAQAYIMADKVRVNGQPAGKSGRMISVDSKLEVLGKDQPFVSRGGVKLQAALDHFGLNPTGLVALDIGASTGGFTHCLILAGAEKVFAVDVGYGQLAWELRQHQSVVSLERTNIRHLEFERLGEYVDLVVIDVSFISLRLIFPKALEFLKPAGSLVALVKPQFEAGTDEVGKRGKVSDSAVQARVLEDLKAEAQAIGFIVSGQTKSSIVGKKSGNEEFFLWLQKP